MSLSVRARGIVIAAAASHSGKTTVTLGMIAALKARGLRVAAAKCGPDYIDPRFLEAATGRSVVNLDTWAMHPDTLLARLSLQAHGADVVVVEGVMGLYDGGTGGAGSTASLAKLTGFPVILVVSAGGMAQSAAAVAEGFARLANGFRIVGAIVNQVASDRHAALIREGFQRSSVPLLGLMRREAEIAIPSRHLGLVQAEEHDDLQKKIARARQLLEEGNEHAEVLTSAPLVPDPASPRGSKRLPPLGQRIAIARDVAFAFAYPHLLDDWREQGAEISFFSPLADEAPAADADAVYLPGGYPELYAGRIAAAETFRIGMLAAAERGALIYGECGGYMVLGESLTDADGLDHPMLGLLPLSTSFKHRMLHLGYRALEPLSDLPWDVPLTAHEFHFARVVSEGDGDRLFEAESAAGEALGPAGLRRGRVMGSFMHVIDTR